MTKTEVINELVSKCGETLLSVEALRQWLSIVVPDLENLNTVTEGSITDRFAGEVDVKNKESITVADLYDAYYNGATDLTISEVTQVGKSAFKDSGNIQNLHLPNALSLGESAFQTRRNLELIDIPKCVTIGPYAFNNCTNLTVVNAPLCETIQQAAFYNCKNLGSISLPSCTEIGANAFRFCENLHTIYLPGDSFVHLYNYLVFDGLPSDYKVYVPEKLYDSYVKDVNWEDVSSHLRIIGASEVVYTGNIDVDAMGNEQQCIIVNGPAPQYTSDKITIVMPETVRLNASTIFIVGDYSSLEDYLNGRNYISHSEASMWQGCRLMNDTSGQLIAGQRYDVVFVISGTDVRFYKGGYDG